MSIETGDNMLHIKVRTFFVVVGSLVIGTNIVNKVVQDIIRNRETIIYNDDAGKRRLTHSEEKTELKLINKFQEVEIINLKKELDECAKNN